jgi:hypothetical protein
MNKSLKVAGAAALGAGIGFAIGFKVAEQKLANRFEERLENETADMREFYTNVRQKYDSPEAAAAALITRKEKENEDPREGTQRIRYDKIVKGEGYADDSDEETACEIEEISVVKNIFEEAQDQSVPHIITQETFMENETGYEQATLTYYSEGGVVADQRDDVIDNPNDVLGKLSPANFGQGSSDPNVVHIRNHSLQMEFEVVKSERSYQQDVLGEDPTEVRQGR